MTTPLTDADLERWYEMADHTRTEDIDFNDDSKVTWSDLIDCHVAMLKLIAEVRRLKAELAKMHSHLADHIELDPSKRNRA